MDDDTQAAKAHARFKLDAGAGADTLSSGKLQCMERMHHRRTHLRDTRQNRRRERTLYDIQLGPRTPCSANPLFFLHPPQLARVLQIS
jgi:hypothetical protein